ncbi:dihydrofolate reductase family protein [Cryobacterium shii]|uniref:Dihydrofolate reductase n=1 Tax=Cryobacterium shii TaxID=1259235 RepID=A0AAQ2C8S0_9MICO|nr:dihydrofolate reductase family protein [Cryobacterium shii]TFC52133.1 dihydrofolate reductase [Cryobacterium shii]
MEQRSWSGHVFIATSVDGFIARSNGDINWLTDTPGETPGDDEFFASVDHLLMGRATYEKVLSFDRWPYGSTPVLVLSSTLMPATQAATDGQSIRVVRTLAEAVSVLNEAGAARVYLDGGKVVRACLAADLVDDLVITRIPVLLGDGIPLFGALPGALPADIRLQTLSAGQISGGMIQERYSVVR